ncbi:hypothetical protein DRJ54_00975 [Candidatus Acetothermia bacterium]|nr:MAG: hypothetical protein DRJ54_00975 [Candidatus Acetothermia bacterium]
MRVIICLAMATVLGIGAFAATPLTIGAEILGGAVVGFTGAVLVGRLGGALVDAAGLIELRTPVVVGFMIAGATGGASLGVIGMGTLLGEEGNVPACVLGAFLGGLAGIFAEPILYTLSGSEPLDPQLEALGMAAVAFLPAIGATIGFNHPLP